MKIEAKIPKITRSIYLDWEEWKKIVEYGEITDRDFKSVNQMLVFLLMEGVRSDTERMAQVPESKQGDKPVNNTPKKDLFDIMEI